MTTGTSVNNLNITLSKNQQKFFAANVESICQKADKDINQGIKEEYL